MEIKRKLRDIYKFVEQSALKQTQNIQSSTTIRDDNSKLKSHSTPAETEITLTVGDANAYLG